MTAETEAMIDVAATHRPRDLTGARAAVLAARDDDANILVRGAGTKLSWAGRPTTGRAWHVIDTRELNLLVSHDAGDMTATVQAGIALHDLQAELGRAGQEFGCDPPGTAGRSTVGGVFVANDGGPRRLRYGGVRDHVIGTTVVLADGTVARSGGDVIKNVAGYDLGKLWCGSLGTLGLVVELTLRLHPVPEATRAVRVPASAPVAAAVVRDLLASPVECSAMEWASVGRGALLLVLEGPARGLDTQVDAMIAIVRRHGAEAEPVDGASDQLDTWRQAHSAEAPATRARATSLPTDLATIAAALTAAVEGTPVEASLYSHAGLGLHDAVLTGGDTRDHAVVVNRWRDAVTRTGGHVVLRERPAELDDHVDPWGDPPPARYLDLMRSVKTALDPHGRFSPGRFVGGI